MVKELKDFIDNWKINVQENFAEHKDGLKFVYAVKGIDGSSKIGISGLAKWYAISMEKGLSDDMTNEKLNELSQEFMEIYNKMILPRQLQERHQNTK